MESADSDHSLSGSISIPQWMKSRLIDRYEVELSALSPPNQDDSFLYLPYPNIGQQQVNTDSGTPTVIVAQGSKPQAHSFTSAESSTSFSGSKISAHTEPCLKYLTDTNKMDFTQALAIMDKDGGQKLLKSLGTDDGFKGEAAKCGRSVVQVAQQMVAERLVGRPRNLNTGNEFDNNKLGNLEQFPIKPRVRRGSKSLPASPLSTPDSTPQIQRKNRFFTGAFVEAAEDAARFPGSWLVTGLLGAHREQITGSQVDLSSDDNNNASIEKKKTRTLETLRRNKSSSMLLQSSVNSKSEAETEELKVSAPLHINASVALTKSGSTGSTPPGAKQRPKPSELREMNFWSPTSM